MGKIYKIIINLNARSTTAKSYQRTKRSGHQKPKVFRNTELQYNNEFSILAPSFQIWGIISKKSLGLVGISFKSVWRIFVNRCFVLHLIVHNFIDIKFFIFK